MAGTGRKSRNPNDVGMDLGARIKKLRRDVVKAKRAVKVRKKTVKKVAVKRTRTKAGVKIGTLVQGVQKVQSNSNPSTRATRARIFDQKYENRVKAAIKAAGTRRMRKLQKERELKKSQEDLIRKEKVEMASRIKASLSKEVDRMILDQLGKLYSRRDAYNRAEILSHHKEDSKWNRDASHQMDLRVNELLLLRSLIGKRFGIWKQGSGKKVMLESNWVYRSNEGEVVNMGSSQSDSDDLALAE